MSNKKNQSPSKSTIINRIISAGFKRQALQQAVLRATQK